MLLLSRSNIQKIFTMREAIEADKLAFRMLAEGVAEVPLRTSIQAPRQARHLTCCKGTAKVTVILV